MKIMKFVTLLLLLATLNCQRLSLRKKTNHKNCFRAAQISQRFGNQKLPSLTKQFTDHNFQANEKSCKEEGKSDLGSIDESACSSDWFRPSEEFNLFGDIAYDEVYQGGLGDCYLIASLMAISKKNSSFISRLFRATQDITKYGLYEVALLIEGEWKLVTLDNQFPGYSQDYFGLLNHTNKELWGMFIEKAIAKVYGSYHQVAIGFFHQCVEMLTGFPGDRVAVNNLDIDKLKSLLSKIKSNDLMASVSTDSKLKNPLLLPGHAYMIKSIKIDNSNSNDFSVELLNPSTEGKRTATFDLKEIKENVKSISFSAYKPTSTIQVDTVTTNGSTPNSLLYKLEPSSEGVYGVSVSSLNRKMRRLETNKIDSMIILTDSKFNIIRFNNRVQDQSSLVEFLEKKTYYVWVYFNLNDQTNLKNENINLRFSYDLGLKITKVKNDAKDPFRHIRQILYSYHNKNKGEDPLELKNKLWFTVVDVGSDNYNTQMTVNVQETQKNMFVLDKDKVFTQKSAEDVFVILVVRFLISNIQPKIDFQRVNIKKDNSLIKINKSIVILEEDLAQTLLAEFGLCLK